ncbi:hypothetical protein B4064_2276 [Caldibacillus thermoamylovorans]|jgi:capsular polysaccharide biosynthesis protein|uniref:YveK family protein n=1 Tax=Caldibacillus thermoamylovorans TaxID=35841 RepID=UPI0005A44F50|nr:hypothetical protein [Caldibacillus thermoamylovorans]KIO66313.1 hypothetical protein B4064_2276 [Caldibacillus thermoamylovorans]MCM3476740.1 hypothetical protein [Caldibacillus thermoamylovorans]
MEETMLLTKTINVLKKFWWIILIFSVLGGIIGKSLYGSGPAPTYSSNVLVFIDNEQISDARGNIQVEDYGRFINTAAVIIKTPVVLNLVKDELNLKEDINELADKIDVTNENGSKILKISVQSTSADKATKLANNVATTFEQVIPNYLDVKKFDIVDKARIKEAKIITHSRTNEITIMGVIIGFVIGTFIAFFLNYFKNRKRTV